jgi:hypothetical protein
VCVGSAISGEWVSERGRVMSAPRNGHNRTFNPNISVNSYKNNDKIDL